MISLFLSILCAHPTVSSIHQTSFLACIVSRQSFDFFERNKAAAIYPVCLITHPSYSHNFPKTKTAINNRELLYQFQTSFETMINVNTHTSWLAAAPVARRLRGWHLACLFSWKKEVGVRTRLDWSGVVYSRVGLDRPVLRRAPLRLETRVET